MVSIETLSEIVKVYDWRGRHTGYRTENTSIPADPGNSHFRRIQAAIKEGKCKEIEPEIAHATRTFSHSGELTGFDTNLGFVPNDSSNTLFRILETSVSAGRCAIIDPSQIEAPSDEKIKTLIVCILFQRSWPHLTGTFARIFAYRSSSNSNPVDLLVRLRNVPADDPPSTVDLVLQAHRVSDKMKTNALPLQAGVLEIEIPVFHLQKLFRMERHRLDQELFPFLDEMLAEHLARSGRTVHRGPDLLWLIMHAPYFLGRLAASLGNTVIRTFIMEWGGVPPGHIREDILHQRCVILGRRIDGRLQWRGGGIGPPRSFSLSGPWPDHGAAIQEALDPEANPLGHRKHIPTRVRQMADAGFGMEAIALLNAFLEVFVREALNAAVFPNVSAMKAVNRIGHRTRLEILRKLHKADIEQRFNNQTFGQTLALAKEIHERRNDYLHNLALPNQENWLSADGDREIMRLIRAFTDASEQMHRFALLGTLWHLKEPTQKFIAAAVLEKVA